MRKFLFHSLAVCLAVALASRTLAQDEPQAIIDKALKAHGGKEKLTKFKATQVKGKGTLSVAGSDIEFTAEGYAQYPNQVKNVLKFEFMGQKVSQTTIVNGDKIVINQNGKDVPITDKIRDETKEQFYAERVSSLLPLADKGYEFAPLGEIKVDGRPALGVKVKSKGHKDVNLFFDKDNGLLVRSESRVFDFTKMKEVDEEKTLRNYKDYEGMKHPTKVVVNHDGDKFMEVEVTELKILEKLDDSNFEP